MKKVLVDTNFLIACVKEKIDFFEEIAYQGYKILIPENVIRELKKIKESKQKRHNRNAAELVLDILKEQKYQTTKFNKRNVDNAIAEFANSKEDIIVATLDKELKKKINKNKMIIRNKKRLEIA